HTRFSRDWSSDVCSSDLEDGLLLCHDPSEPIASAECNRCSGLQVPRPLTYRGAGLPKARTERVMAGHSKWANIQHRKGKQDKLRSEERRVGKEWRAEWGR